MDPNWGLHVDAHTCKYGSDLTSNFDLMQMQSSN